MEEQIRKNKLNDHHSERNSRTHSSSSTKRDKLEVVPFVIRRAIKESLRVELLWFLPVTRISIDSPGIHQHFGFRWDLVPVMKLHLLGVFSGNE
ncbi:hypothetical protein LINPERHAP1_LOCUS25472 [Linum perenne]